jgi:N-acetylglutamate synthase-like GNAT family acetyltransferase
MNHQEFQIINYDNQYRQQVIDLLLNIWEGEFDYKGLERPDIYDVPKFYQDNDKSNFWLALKDGDLIGTVGLIAKNEHLAFLKRMAIKKEFRHQGLGKQLLETAVNFAKEKGLQKVYAGTVEENPNAIRFYEKHGFKRIEEVPEDIASASDSVCLELSL